MDSGAAAPRGLEAGRAGSVRASARRRSFSAPGGLMPPGPAPQYDLAKHASTWPGLPHWMQPPEAGGGSSGRFRMVAWVAVFICASQPASPHHGAIT